MLTERVVLLYVIFLNGTTISNLEVITNFLLILARICGMKNEKAVANKMDICHSCLTYFGVTRVWSTLSGLEDLILVNIFRLNLMNRNIVQNERYR